MGSRKSNFEVPVLINAFNRPGSTQQVLNAVKKVRPSKLFLAIDGPREGDLNDLEKSKRIKEIFDSVDWKCSVKKLYRRTNLGCPRAIPEAIDWFFSEVDFGIILEDDCLPNYSFFQFCEDMLNRFNSNDRIMMVSGNNFMPGKKFSDYSYFFSKYGFIWGWATWKNSWKKFDNDMNSYPNFIKSESFRRRYPNILDRYFWKTAFRNKYYGFSQGWAMKWNYAMAINDGLSILPSRNLVENIGFGPDATMTKTIDKKMMISTQEINFPLSHPRDIVENLVYDKKVFRRNFLSTVNIRTLTKNYVNARRGTKKC